MAMAVRYTNFGGRIVAERRAGVRKSYSSDSLGSTIAMYDATGNITDTWEYWPYGEVRTRTGTTPTAFQYVGTLGYYTDTTGNLYVRARSYQPKTTRWMSVDPLWPQEQAYGYAGQGPVSAVDPSGTDPIPIAERVANIVGIYCYRGPCAKADYCVAALCSMGAAIDNATLGKYFEPSKFKDYADGIKRILKNDAGPSECCDVIINHKPTTNINYMAIAFLCGDRPTPRDFAGFCARAMHSESACIKCCNRAFLEDYRKPKCLSFCAGTDWLDRDQDGYYGGQ